MVWVEPALSHAAVNDATDTTVAAPSDFGDGDDLIPIPLLSVAFAAYRNYGDLKAGRIDSEAFAYNRTQAGWVALREASQFLHPELKLRLAKVKRAMDEYQRVTGMADAPAAMPQAT